MTRAFTIPLLLSAALLGACRGEYALDPGQDLPADQLDDTGPGGTDTDDTDPDDSGESAPTWWALSGQLDIIDGQVSKAGSELVLSIVGDDLIEDPALCESAPEILSAMPAVADDDLEIWGWWTVTFADEGFPDCAPQSFVSTHQTLTVGIGQLDPLLNPALDADGLDYTVAAQTVYGLYVQEHADGPVFIFGISGTQQNFSGDAGTVTAGPLPDGQYTLKTLHLLPL